MRESERKARLLIGNYESIDNLAENVVYNNYYCTDKLVPMLRYRGVIVDCRHIEKKRIKLTGWQRDITCMRKMDVSLPFIVNITLCNNIIEEITIDKSFNGGKGILCSREYLQSNIQDKFINQVFDKTFLQKIKLNNIHCFHIYEILNSMYSYYSILSEIHTDIENSNMIFYDEEAIDSYAENGNLFMVGMQEIKNNKTLKYKFIFYDIFNNIAFNNEGYMRIVDPIKAEFYIEDQLMCSEILTQSENDYLFIKIQKFLLKCIHFVKEFLWSNSKVSNKVRIMNTNLVPGAMIGFLIQCAIMRIFKDNYNYIQYDFTALQRPGKIPGCLGSILNEDEASKYFEGYNISKLI